MRPVVPCQATRFHCSRSVKLRVGLRSTCAILAAGILVLGSGQSLLGRQAPVPEFESAEMTGPETAPAVVQPMRCRLVWGGGAHRTWRCRVRTSAGAITSPVALGLHPDASASVWLEPDGLHLDQAPATGFNGVDFDLTGPLDGVLTVELEAVEGDEAVFRHSWPLRELLHGSQSQSLDEEGNRVTLARAPGDALRVSTGRPHLVFEPGESWEPVITPNLVPELAGRQAILRGWMTPARKSRPVMDRQSRSISLDSSGSNGPIAWPVQVPAEEGVYDLHLEIIPRWYQASFQSAGQYRRIQFIVIDSAGKRDAEMAGVGDPWKVTGTASLAPPPASMVLPDPVQAFRKLPGMTPLHPGVTALEKPDHWTLLPVGGWKVVDLPIGEKGMPHRVTVRLRSPGGMAAGLSVLQPDEAGNLPAIGEDTGVAFGASDLTSQPAGEHGQPCEQTIYFWPNHSQPKLLVANRHATAGLEIGLIEVASGPRELPRLFPGTGDAGGAEVGGGRRRQLLGCFEAPLFVDRFGASRTMDPVSGQPLDDWQTFYEGTDRWIQYLRASGQTGAVLCVAADGSALYPSGLLRPNPRYDSGVFFHDAADPVRKDVLELILRMFDRAGLTLVAVLEAKQPLPGLESLRRSAPAGSIPPGAMVLANGQVTGREAQQPLYDPLCEPVRQELRFLLLELAERYRSHGSLKGLGLVLRPDTWIQALETESGFHPDNLRAFSLSSGVGFPDDTAGAIRVLVDGGLLPKWVAWRNQSATAFWTRLSDSLLSAGPELRLYLAQADTFDQGQLAERTDPRLHEPQDPAAIAAAAGWDLPAWRSEQIVLLQPHRVAPQDSVIARRREAGIEPVRAAVFRNVGYQAALFSHRSAPVQFSEPVSRDPSGQTSSRLIRLQPMTPAGTLNRRRFSNALHAADLRCVADGGWLPAAGQEAATGRWFEAFGRLPDQRFEDVKHDSAVVDSGAVRVRQSAPGQEWFAYAVNASPWPVSVSLALSGSSPVIPESWGNGSAVWAAGENGGLGRLQVELEPWGLVVVRVRGLETSATGFVALLPASAGGQLQEKVFGLQSLLTQNRNPAGKNWVRNADFELASGRPEGWRWNEAAGDQVGVVLGGPNGAGQCLELRGGVQPVWIRSSEFGLPETGRLTLVVRLQADRPWDRIPLRLSVESSSGTQPWYRFGTVNESSATGRRLGSAETAAGGWNEYVVHFDQLPTGPNTRLRVGFDLMGPGTVRVDDVQLYDSRLSERDVRALAQMVATAGNLLGNPQHADQCRRVLEGYWPLFFEELAIRQMNESRQLAKVAEESAGTGGTPAIQTSAPLNGAGSGPEEDTAGDPVDGSPRSPWRLRRPRRANEPLLPVHRSQ